MRHAEIIAIGSELLTPFRTDTNSLYLTRTLEQRGIRVVAKTIVGDEIPQLKFAFETALKRSDLMICSGGLGPTQDDLTKEALAEYLNLELEFRVEIYEAIQARFAKRGLTMPETNRKQAFVLQGAQILQNNNGTAPGIYLCTRGKQIFLLPGPPFELEPMWQDFALPLVAAEAPIQRAMFRIAMLPESQVEEMLKPVTTGLNQTHYTILAAPSDIEIHLMADFANADELINTAAQFRAILGSRIYTEDNRDLQEVVGTMLKDAHKTVAVAESCTGGWLAQRLTSVPGSSAYFNRGVVTYTNESKSALLSVAAHLIQQYGAVSEHVASAMADAVRKTASVDFGISITGIAGPEGGTAEKPVGTVFVGLSDGETTRVRRYNFPGNRARIRFSSTQAALNLLRLRLLEAKS